MLIFLLSSSFSTISSIGPQTFTSDSTSEANCFFSCGGSDGGLGGGSEKDSGHREHSLKKILFHVSPSLIPIELIHDVLP